MKANMKACGLTARALGERGPKAANGSAALACGWVVNDDGALLLKSQLGTFDRPADMDLTGFEATHNHIHLDPQTSQASERIDLWAQAVAMLYEGLRGATAAAGGRRCVGIASLGGAGQGATIRWHLDHGERWLSDDLEGFLEEAVLVVASEDLSDDRMIWPD